MANREFTEEEAEAHNALTKEAWKLINPLIVLNESPVRGGPSWFERRKLKKAASLFERALEINPNGDSSMWAIGKIYQRLGDNTMALKWFEHAHRANPEQPDVAREASLSALDIGDSISALRYCEIAIRLSPDDPGLVSNLALAHLLAGDDTNAFRTAEEASSRDPSDAISKTVMKFVDDVSQGRKPRPKTLAEAFPLQ
jgi:tetratricopeptide (TPR) repeat protein